MDEAVVQRVGVNQGPCKGRLAKKKINYRSLVPNAQCMKTCNK